LLQSGAGAAINELCVKCGDSQFWSGEEELSSMNSSRIRQASVVSLLAFLAAWGGGLTAIAQSPTPLTTWTEQSTATSPPPRYGAAMAYDASTGQVVLFGGEVQTGTSNVSLSDTWTWDGTTWTQQFPTTSPPPRYDAAMAYDAVNGQVVLFGGAVQTENGLLSDTWTWNGTTWTQQFPTTSPSPRYGAATAYDASTGQVLLFGGEIQTGTNFYTGASYGPLSDTWTWNGTSWTQQLPPTSPPPRFEAAMAYDASIGQVLLFGGNGTNDTNMSDTWIWNGTTWTQQFPTTSPSPRYGATTAYDASKAQVVLLGGWIRPQSGPSSGQGPFSDTWTWNGTTWTQQFPVTSPAPRFEAAMAYDASISQVLLFGGNGNYPAFGDTWTLQLGRTALAPSMTVFPNPANVPATQAMIVNIAVSGGSGNPTPTGSVTVSSGRYTSSATSLIGGSAAITVPAGSLAIGTDTLTASYAGDDNYRPATGSASVAITALDMPTPSFSPSGGTYSSTQAVTIGDTVSGATIYYTTNGATPTTSSAIYNGPITVSASEIVKAIAVANGYNPSATGSASYTVSSGSTGGAQGVYFGSTSNGEAFEGVVLPNNTFYALYGTTSGNTFNIMGMITGPGNSSNGTYSATISDYYYSGATYTGSVSASYVGGASINGTIFDSGVGTLPFTGSALPTSLYNYNIPASLSTIVGTWNGALLGGGGASVSINSTGTFAGSSQGCSYSGSINPDASGMNFFDFSLTYGGSPCLLPYQTQTGIAIDYLLSDGVTRQLIAGVSSGSSGNVFAANSTGASPSAQYSLSATSPTVAPGSSGTATVTVSSTSGYTGTIALSCTLTSSLTGAQDVPTCQGNPTVNLSSSTASGVATFTVNTTGATNAMALPQPGGGKGWSGAGSSAVLAVLVLLWVPKGRNVWRSMLCVAFAITIISGITGCAGGSSSNVSGSGTSTSSPGTAPGTANPGTTPGAYTFTVSGTGNDSAKTTAITTFTLTVN
jgi:hypothetical protein